MIVNNEQDEKKILINSLRRLIQKKRIYMDITISPKYPMPISLLEKEMRTRFEDDDSEFRLATLSDIDRIITYFSDILEKLVNEGSAKIYVSRK
jgi:hypothetical protein